MGNSPMAYLHCERCDVSKPLPYRQWLMFYWDEKSQQRARVPCCLGFCDDCQQFCSVEDFSLPIATLRQRLWTMEQQKREMVGHFWPRFILRFWPAGQRRYAGLGQQIAATELLLQVRQLPERHPRCLKCGSFEITAFPAYPYQESCFLAAVPDTLPHSCGELWQVKYLDFSGHIGTTPRYYNMAGEALL